MSTCECLCIDTDYMQMTVKFFQTVAFVQHGCTDSCDMMPACEYLCTSGLHVNTYVITYIHFQNSFVLSPTDKSLPYEWEADYTFHTFTVTGNEYVLFVFEDVLLDPELCTCTFMHIHVDTSRYMSKQ